MVAVILLYAVTLLDQWTKYLVHSRLSYGTRIVIIPSLLDLSHVRNTGAAWGLLAGQQALLISISLLVLLLLAVYGRRTFGLLLAGQVTLGLLSAGICGNLIDRLRLGYVVDFIDLHWNTAHFPSFNVADMAICTGVGLYLLTHHLHERTRRRQPLPAEAA